VSDLEAWLIASGWLAAYPLYWLGHYLGWRAAHRKLLRRVESVDAGHSTITLSNRIDIKPGDHVMVVRSGEEK